MFTNEDVLIRLLSENDDIAKTLKELYDDVKKEEAILYRKKMRHERIIYKDYNRARDKMIKYLFKLNRKHQFMAHVTIYDYPSIISSIESLIISLEMFNLAFESCSLS